MKDEDVNKKPKAHSPRRILTNTRSMKAANETKVDLESLLEDTIKVIHMDIRKLKAKVNRDAILDPKEGVRIRGYLESLVKVSKDRRDAGKKAEEEASKLSTEDLLRKATKLLTPEQLKSLLSGDSK